MVFKVIAIMSNPNEFLSENLNIDQLFHFVDSRYHIKKSGYNLNPQDSRIFYKMRHNVFKTMVTYFLGLPNFEEKSFLEYNLCDSNRTPDFLSVNDDEVLLIEYTVTNTLKASILNKESQGKYDAEVSLMSKRYKVFDLYFCLSLDQDISELFEQISSNGHLFSDMYIEDLFSSLSSLKEEMIYLNWYINDKMPELLENVDQASVVQLNVTPLDIKLPFKTTVTDLSVKRSQNVFLKKRIKSKLFTLSKSFRRKARNLNYKLIYNFQSDTLITQFSEDGMSKSELMNLIQTEDDRVFEICEVRGSYVDLKEPFQKYGSYDKEIDFSDRSRQFLEVVDDNGYQDMLYQRLKRVEVPTLCDCDLEVDSKLVSTTYFEALSSKNSSSSNMIRLKKNPFIFPVTIGLTKQGERIHFHSRYNLTNSILQRAKNIVNKPSTFIDRKIDYDKLTSVESQTSKLWSRIKNIKDIRKFMRTKEMPPDITAEQISEISQYRQLRSEFSTALGEATRTQYSNRVTFPISFLDRHFSEEMEHFNKVKGKVNIYPENDFENLLESYKKLILDQFLMSNEMTSDDIYSSTEPQGIKLVNACIQMQSTLKARTTQFRKTNLAHTLQFISNFSYSLMYYSNIKLNKNDFCVDTMGYNNAMIIVKGGKKIVSTRRSRLFKLLFPINNNLKNLTKTKSMEFITIDDQIYAITPWRQLKQDYLKVGMELYSNFSNYYINLLLESDMSDLECQQFSSVKIIAMFSQKRKMEIWLSNFRYIYFNSTGIKSDVLDLVKNMVEYDYDSFFYLIQRLFLNEYENLYKSSQENKVYDFLWGNKLENFDLAAEKFDEAIFMTKSPVDNYNEHLLNLRTILETHDYFRSFYPSDNPFDILERSSIDMTDPKFHDNLYENDFIFDPKLCYLIGKDCSQTILSSITTNDINTKFANILSDSYTDIKTSKGMRSSSGLFWGKKGFDVIFDDEKFSNAVKDIITSFPFTSRQEFEKKIRDFDITFSDVISDMDHPEFEFDIKDKIGSKGRREIYVMTDNTKLLQQPIERLMKYLCNVVPNELIHKKSHIRPKIIHQKIFESVEEETTTIYATLDCRKWAPRSNIWKYVYFILGMRDCLPDSFIEYFLKVWFLMFKKRIRIQQHYISSLRKNPNVSELLKHLKSRPDGDYELVMPYSFMMGIFNYLSSIFHAATQVHFNKNVATKCGTNYNLMAHSDDSGGTISGKNVNTCVRSFVLYEHYQKACNHLLSRKKSVLSKDSFELISIMYSKKRFIPMTYKFVTNVSFNPSGAGWYTDICSVVSLLVDVFQNGGSFLTCYSTMLSAVELYRKAYHLPRSKLLSSIPLHFGGVFNMHPIHLILLGSCAQEVMLDLVESPRARNHRIHMYNLFNGEYVPGRGSNLKYKTPYIVKHNQTLELDDEESKVLSNLSLFNEKRTMIDSLKYFNDLRKMKFQYSLLNIDSFKILFSTLFFRSNVVRLDEQKYTPLTDLASNFMGFQILGEYEKTYFEPYSNEISYMRASENISMDFEKNTIPSKKSCKPMLYTTFVNLGLNLSYDDLCHLIIHNSGKEYSILNKNPKKWESLTHFISNALPGENIEEKMRTLTSMERQDVIKTRSAYLFVPSGTNIDTLERFWTFTLLRCSRRYYISSQKPQFYSLEQFEFWKLPYENLKHHYFLVKMILEDNDLKGNLEKYRKSINKCNTCQEKSFTLNTIDELYQISKRPQNSIFETDMPFAVYDKPQYRGPNVWYGTSDFKLYTKFGSVQHYTKEGKIITVFSMYDDNFLDQIWYLYKIFTSSRGIDTAQVVYGNTGFQVLKLAFNDMDNPFRPQMNTFNQVLENSQIKSAEYSIKKFNKRDNKIYFEDMVVDFNIYHVYDINDYFYKSHNLRGLKDNFMNKVSSVNRDFLLNNFLSSKSFDILSTDDYHKNTQNLMSKYNRVELLGAPGSLTRALCESNQSGKTKYRSTADLKNLDLGPLERQTISQVPIIDLYSNSAYTRLTHFDYLTLSKLSNNEILDARDYNNIDQMIRKLGLVATASLLVTYKEMFKTFDSSALLKMPTSSKIAIILNLLKTIQNSMDDVPKRRTMYQFGGKRIEFWKTLKNLDMKDNINEYASLLTSGLYRGQSDNLKKFWETKRENSFSMIINVHFYTSSNCFFLIKNILGDILSDGKKNEILDYCENIKFYRLSKADNLIEIECPEDYEDFEPDAVYKDISIHKFGSVYLPEGSDLEDDLDAINEND
uniref:RNA-directed RNA polymerase L n=2 Tax=Halophytophthora RNA virus 5 TaxID=2717547 RepID=A0A7D5K0S0_9VIRU|nr:RNA-dependent RNA polymerase [Halophytophthora RNA virus 5]